MRPDTRKMGIHTERTLLFGSHAKGMNEEGSDIDLIAVPVP